MLVWGCGKGSVTLHDLRLGSKRVEGVDIFWGERAEEETLGGDMGAGRVGGIGTLGSGGLDPDLGGFLGLLCGRHC